MNFFKLVGQRYSLGGGEPRCSGKKYRDKDKVIVTRERGAQVFKIKKNNNNNNDINNDGNNDNDNSYQGAGSRDVQDKGKERAGSLRAPEHHA